MSDYQISNGYVGSLGVTFEAATDETLADAIRKAAVFNDTAEETIRALLESGATVKWCKSPNYYYDHSHGVICRKPQPRTPDYPDGRRLSCGCTVYWKHEVMSASRGSSCFNCYDRMSD